MTNKSEKVIKQALKSKPQKTTRKDIQFYSSGISLLDLCLGGGFGKGCISNIIGGESSGKTLLGCETIGCNYAKSKKFKHFIDDAESGFTLDTEYLWNFKANLIIPKSETVEEFEYNIEKTLSYLRENNGFYVLDSLDGLSNESEQKKYKKKISKMRKKVEEDKESNEKEKGEYVGAGKAKEMSLFFRILNGKIEKTGLHLLVLSQKRDKIGVLFGKREDRTGGKALNYYAGQIIWLYVIQKIERTVIIDGVKYERINEVLIRADVTKNKLGKAFRKCFLFVNLDMGVDNIKSNIYFLYNLITPKGELRKLGNLSWDKKEYTLEKLIKYIEDNNLEIELEKRVISLWNEIEEKIITSRKRKY